MHERLVDWSTWTSKGVDYLLRESFLREPAKLVVKWTPTARDERIWRAVDQEDRRRCETPQRREARQHQKHERLFDWWRLMLKGGCWLLSESGGRKLVKRAV